MSQAYTISGQITVNNNNVRTIVTLTDTTTTTSSNAISNNVNVATGSWQVLDSGSNTTFRFGYFANTDLTSSVKIAMGSTASNASILQPGDFCILTNNTSSVIYLQATGSNSPVLLQYVYSGS